MLCRTTKTKRVSYVNMSWSSLPLRLLLWVALPTPKRASQLSTVLIYCTYQLSIFWIHRSNDKNTQTKTNQYHITINKYINPSICPIFDPNSYIMFSN